VGGGGDEGWGMSRLYRAAAVFLLTLLWFAASSADAGELWSRDRAAAWYGAQRWIVGANYVPASAVNQIEMWRADTFDPERIDRELGLAQDVGMNTVRVFLHDSLWQEDAPGLRRRIDIFLGIAARHGVRPILALFDSCWNPVSAAGPQPPPVPGVHNSQWVQGPSARALADPAEYGRLERYVRDVVGAFGHDPRVLAWDIWNEPGNDNGKLFPGLEAANKTELTAALLRQAFSWARAAGAEQPLTSGLWQGGRDWSQLEALSEIERIQLEQSDILSFHSYEGPKAFEARIRQLTAYGRPIVCSEFLARAAGSTVDAILPIAQRLHVGAVNWGLVAGRTQTYLPWDSWRRPYVGREPTDWQHDLFQADGSPYRESEVELIRKLIAESRASQ